LLVAVAVHGEQVFHPHSMKHVVVQAVDQVDKRQTEVMVEQEAVKAVPVAEDHYRQVPVLQVQVVTVVMEVLQHLVVGLL
jgi:hypothetical protein